MAHVEEIAVTEEQIRGGEPNHGGKTDADDNVVRYLSEKYGLKRRWVQNLIAHHGNNRLRLEEAARELTGS